MSLEKFCKEVIQEIEKGAQTQRQIEFVKSKLSGKHGLDEIPKNSVIAAYASGDVKKLLKTKPVRTGSGVAIIAVMFIPENASKNGYCPGECIYCPRGENSPQSYTGNEPATLRAQRHGFDPFKQTAGRLKQLHIIGHETDKCELIIMGGTFSAIPTIEQENFIKGCLDAMNGEESDTLEEAQLKNERAEHRCIGLTIETRPDYCDSERIKQMMKLGCTRVEIGLQTTDESLMTKIGRNHTVEDVKEAVKLCKNNGLKVTLHWMPGLTGIDKLDVDKEVDLFEKMFDSDLRPDELKIYPTLVIKKTELYELWKDGKYEALTNDKTIELLKRLKEKVPAYIRIKRVMRDISEHEVAAGTKTTNLRQLIEKDVKCKCIRCREAHDDVIKNVEMREIEYDASDGKEHFISFEGNNKIVGFIRVRVCDAGIFVRELHIYGPMIPVGKKGGKQHEGYGKLLIKRAEELAKKSGKKELLVTSGVGARDYYRKLGYELKNGYMVKKL